jgi:hypothetical protein
MSWINDVNYELSKLEYSKKNLRKFGITVGLVFLLFAVGIYFIGNLYIFPLISTSIGLLLFILGLFSPSTLKKVFQYWMKAAFILGWFISRFLLTILFFVVLTPIAFIAKLFRKEFLNLSYKRDQKSYWIKKTASKINYEKMY